MSAGTRTIKYSAVAVVLAAIIIGSSMYYVSTPTTSSASAQSVLVVQLTDPPVVPAGTSSLNLTYSAADLVVSEPAFSGKVTINFGSITPSGGSATVDLLHLRSVSQTIASANLPTGSVIYTIGFKIKSIAITINGTVYQVSAHAPALVATLIHPVSLDRNATVLVELTPVVMNTSTGYKMIPYLVGILKPQSEYKSSDQNMGAKDQVSLNDQQELDQAWSQAGWPLGW